MVGAVSAAPAVVATHAVLHVALEHEIGAEFNEQVVTALDRDHGAAGLLAEIVLSWMVLLWAARRDLHNLQLGTHRYRFLAEQPEPQAIVPKPHSRTALGLVSNRILASASTMRSNFSSRAGSEFPASVLPLILSISI